jgi:hypothetical protein
MTRPDAADITGADLTSGIATASTAKPEDGSTPDTSSESLTTATDSTSSTASITETGLGTSKSDVGTSTSDRFSRALEPDGPRAPDLLPAPDGEVVSGEWVRVPSDALPARRPGPVTSEVAAPTLDEPRRDRVEPRDGALVDDPADTDEPEPVEPAEPVVSATATGTEAIADPTPNATANAPTRPT